LYECFELTDIVKFIETLVTEVVVIGNVVLRYIDLTKLKDMLVRRQISYILIQDLEVKADNQIYSIKNDKDLMAFSGILGSLRECGSSTPPIIPKVAVFVSLCLFRKLL
jgi:hypothetical protein